jgi:O-acetylhomoserine/O-acetylserine sulfhydrylase-like pyridoxal-dependent enzyme
MDRRCSNAQTVAEFTAKGTHRSSGSRYPGPSSHPEDRALWPKLCLPQRGGAILGFGIEGGAATGQRSPSTTSSCS